MGKKFVDAGRTLNQYFVLFLMLTGLLLSFQNCDQQPYAPTGQTDPASTCNPSGVQISLTDQSSTQLPVNTSFTVGITGNDLCTAYNYIWVYYDQNNSGSEITSCRGYSNCPLTMGTTPNVNARIVSNGTLLMQAEYPNVTLNSNFLPISLETSPPGTAISNVVINGGEHDIYLDSGDNYTLTVTANGSPKYYRWFTFNPQNQMAEVPGAVSNTFQGENVTVDEDGTKFQALVYNDINSLTSATVTLHVRSGINFVQHPGEQGEDLDLTEGEDLQLLAEVEGASGTYIFQWQKYVNDSWTNVAGQTNLNLLIQNTTVAHSGRYRLKVNDATDTAIVKRSNYVDVVVNEVDDGGGDPPPPDDDDWVPSDDDTDARGRPGDSRNLSLAFYQKFGQAGECRGPSGGKCANIMFSAHSASGVNLGSWPKRLMVIRVTKRPNNSTSYQSYGTTNHMCVWENGRSAFYGYPNNTTYKNWSEPNWIQVGYTYKFTAFYVDSYDANNPCSANLLDAYMQSPANRVKSITIKALEGDTPQAPEPPPLPDCGPGTGVICP